jgi:apolipoprotein N-acyltransferase
MRLIFGVMAVLIVLAVVGTLGKTQLQALGLTGQRAADAAKTAAPVNSPAAVAAPVQGNIVQQSQGMQKNVRDAAAAALQQGADRSAQEPKP